jgi:hypothetical protein
MTSPSTRASNHPIGSRIALTVGGGSAGWLGTLALIHKPGSAVLAAASVSAALALNAVAWVGHVLPEIIRALGDYKKASAEAKVLRLRAKARIKLAMEGTDPEIFPQAAEMLKLLSIDPDMAPDGRRLPDGVLARLLTAARPKTISTKPRGGPRRPRGSPDKPDDTSGNNVAPLRPDG